jgi:hypothetical protein
MTEQQTPQSSALDRSASLPAPACCDSVLLSACCAPEAKPHCCGAPAAPVTCGCRKEKGRPER